MVTILSVFGHSYILPFKYETHLDIEILLLRHYMKTVDVDSVNTNLSETRKS